MSEREDELSPVAPSPDGATLGDLDGVLARRSGDEPAGDSGAFDDTPEVSPSAPSASTVSRTSVFAPRSSWSQPVADSYPATSGPSASSAPSAGSASGADTTEDGTGEAAPADSAKTTAKTTVIPGIAGAEKDQAVAVQTAATSAPGPRHGGPAKGVKVDGDTDKPRRKWPWVAVAVLALLAGAYVGVAYHYADRVPTNTQVAGVDLSGMTRDQAEAALRDGLAERAAKRIELTIVPTQGEAEEQSSEEATEESTEVESESASDDSAAPSAGHGGAGARGTSAAAALPIEGEQTLSGTINPADASLQVDYPASVNQVVGLTFNPVKLWQHFSGKKQFDAIVAVDHDKLSAAVTQLAEQINTAPVEGALEFDGPRVVRTEPAPGYELMVDKTVETISDQWLKAPPPLSVPAKETDPVITKEILDQADQQVAQKVISGPVVVTVGSHKATLEVADLAAAASFTADGAALNLSVDGKSLAAKVAPQVPEAMKSAKDATVVIEGGAPKIIDGTPGVGIDDEALSAMLPQAVASDDRTVEAPLHEVQPEFTREDAEKLGIKEVVSEIKTPLTSDNVRTTNLRVGARYVNNTLVKPGERFSLLTALGPITPERGFVSSGVVENGVSSTALGGGLSQMSTNTFNVGWLAGMKDIQHKPHSKYFSRYPAGRESTVWSPNLDMIWENTTPYGALVEAWVADGYVHTRLWSTKYWKVTTHESEPYNFTPPATLHRSGPDCKPATGFGRGFTINVYRKIEHGDESHEDRYTWTYTAFSNVVCE